MGCQWDECDGCLVTRSQARGHGSATDGAAKGRDDATERIEVGHTVQSNSASANAKGSARSSAPASDMQGDDRKALTELGFEGSERTCWNRNGSRGQ